MARFVQVANCNVRRTQAIIDPELCPDATWNGIMPHTPTFLMTDSSHFEVSYKINPWMTPETWRANEAQNRAHARAAQQELATALRQAGARVTIMEGVPGLPDMVFPANAAIVLNGRAMAARFRHHERQGEERHFFSKFMRLEEEGLLQDVARAPKGIWQEGAGDLHLGRLAATVLGGLRATVVLRCDCRDQGLFRGAGHSAGTRLGPILPPRYLLRSLKRRRNSLLPAGILQDVACRHQGPRSGGGSHRGKR